jgi:hypothetical protein
MKTSRMDQFLFWTQQQSALNKCFMGPEFQQPAAFPTETQRVMSGLFIFLNVLDRVEGERIVSTSSFDPLPKRYGCSHVRGLCHLRTYFRVSLFRCIPWSQL